jgi:sugar phosphate isomerase/epimerase
MTHSPLSQRLAVCSWSLQPAHPTELAAQLQSVGVHRIQLALDPLRESPQTWAGVADVCRRESIEIVSGMCGCVGEDYSTLDTIRKTGGIVPDSTWDRNRSHMEAAVSIASALGLGLVTFHAGFLPHTPTDPLYIKIQRRLRELADLFATHGIAVALETGQETADTLGEFLSNLDRSNVGVNFDPANMILYDKGDPVQALETLGPWVRQVHIKDARRTRVSGTWGEEVQVGTGEVDWVAFTTALTRIPFRGNACIERESGENRVEDIRAGREHIESLSPGTRQPS